MNSGNRLASMVRLELGRWATGGDSRSGLLDWIEEYLPDHCDRAFSPLHDWLAAELEAMQLHRGQKLALVGPRGSAKSTICTLAYILRVALEGREKYIWLISDTKTQAETHLDNIRLELTENTRILADYGRQSMGSTAVLNNSQIRLANGVVIESYGTGQALRGRRRGAFRPTLVVCDDLQNDSHVVSAFRRSASLEWFRSTLLPAGRRNTNYVVLGTALHRDCIACRYLNAPGWLGKSFKSVISWPSEMALWNEWESVYCEARNAVELQVARDFYEENQVAMDIGSEILWPSEESLYQLMALRVEIGSTSFDREKQSLPVDPDRCEWPSDYFGDSIWFNEWPDEGLKVLALDPSKGKSTGPKKGKQGDYSAMLSLLLAPDGCIYVDADFRREPVPMICQRVVDKYHEFKPSRIAFESNNFQELISNELERCASGVGGLSVLPVEGIVHTTNKETRIRRLGTWLSRRRFKFMSNPGTRLLVDQLRDFPIGDHDDGPDALELGMDALDRACGPSVGEVVAGRVF